MPFCLLSPLLYGAGALALRQSVSTSSRMSVVTILPRLGYCSIDALDGKGPIARRVDCSGMDPSIAKLVFDDRAGAGWTEPVRDDGLPNTLITQLSAEEQAIAQAWETAPPFPSRASGLHPQCEP